MSKAPILSPSSPFKLALIQLAIGADKSKNLQHAKSKILEAAGHGANVVVLPVSQYLLQTSLILISQLDRNASTHLMAQTFSRNMPNLLMVVIQWQCFHQLPR
jgi:hypothetical protein